MATIPLPALHTAPIEKPPNMIEMYGQMMGIKNQQQQMDQRQAMAPLQQQEAQQAVQSGQLDVEAKQRAANDQRAMSAAMQQWGKAAPAAGRQPAGQPVSGSASQPSATPQTGGVSDPDTNAPLAPGGPLAVNGQAGAGTGAQPGAPKSALPSYDDLVPLAIKNGASFSAVQGLQAHVLEMKAKASTIAKDDAQAGTANAENTIKKNGMISDAMMGVMSLPDEQLSQGILTAAQELSQKGLFDPQHAQMAQQLATLAQTDPAQARQQLHIQNLSLGAFSKELENQGKELANKKMAGESDPTSPFYAPSPASVAMGTAPGASAIRAGEAKAAGQKAGAEAAARQPYEIALLRQRMVVAQGDPQMAGQLLVNGDATLSELKTRGATPEFIGQALTAAHRLSGGTYNAQQADAQFDVAKSPANVAFFGSAKSLTDKGGTLDQLQANGKALPGALFPAFNSIADWEKAATGSGPIAKYASTALGVADDYAKVMGGGQGSDTSRLQALNLIGAKQSPDQRAASIEGIRGAVGSQLNSRIGNNPVLQRMYGSTQPAAGGGGGAQPQDGSTKVNSHGDKIIFKGGQWQLAQ